MSPSFLYPDGRREWFLDDTLTVLHRTDGPAVERTNGIKAWWYLNDERVQMEDVFTDPKDQFWWIMKS